MASPLTRYWLTMIVAIEAIFAFFAGVYFAVWGDSLTSPVWVWIMSVPGGGGAWGSLFLIFGGLFLFGLEWNRSWPRVLGCAGAGLLYVAIGIILGVAPFFNPASLNGSVGMWLLGGTLTCCLAGFMHAERRQEILDGTRKETP